MNGIRAYHDGACTRTRQPLRTSILSVRRVTSETIEKGAIVWIEYDAWTVNPNGTLTLFDTTHDEVAKKEGKFDEKSAPRSDWKSRSAGSMASSRRSAPVASGWTSTTRSRARP